MKPELFVVNWTASCPLGASARISHLVSLVPPRVSLISSVTARTRGSRASVSPTAQVQSVQVQPVQVQPVQVQPVQVQSVQVQPVQVQSAQVQSAQVQSAQVQA
jgi:hypothetical protein